MIGADIDIKFWKKWIDATDTERIELIKTLPICLEIKEDVARYGLASLLNAYFEDLYHVTINSAV
jgi:hypothetical protein